MRYSRSKEINNVVKSMIKQGWGYRRGSKHGQLVTPTGRKWTIPFTPSDRRAAMNFEKGLKRLIEEETTRQAA